MASASSRWRQPSGRASTCSPEADKPPRPAPRSRGRRSAPPSRTEEVRLASERQKILVDRCLEAVRRARAGALAGLPLDAVALEAREAAGCLGEITGEIAGEEVFDRIFGSFCLGK